MLTRHNELAEFAGAVAERYQLAMRSDLGIVAGVLDALEAKMLEMHEDARALAQRVFDTELLSDAEIEILLRYLPHQKMIDAGYVK